MKVSLIGSGNVATHLARLLFSAGHTIECIYNPHGAHARKLARQVNARVVRRLEELSASDCLVLAVKDDALAGIIRLLPTSRQLVVHTSGSEPLRILKVRFPNCGVLYPVQTLTADTPAPASIPLCLEASNAGSLRRLRVLAKSVSDQVLVVNSRKRLAIHAAAVFANNFTNHLYVIASEVLAKEGLPMQVLLPLIEETASKAKHHSPRTIQTGPAQRGDKKTMQAHLKLLGRNKKYKALYKLLSDSIAGTARKK